MKSEALKIDTLNLLKVAVPISLGTLVQFFVVLTDNFFLSRVSEAAINGAGNAALVYLTLCMVAVGSGTAFQIVIARRIGEQDSGAAFRTFRTGLLVHLSLGVILLAIVSLLNRGILVGFLSLPEVAAVFEPFLGVRQFGLIPFSLLLACNALFTGMAKTWPILLTSGSTALINVVLDMAFVGGYWGFESQGAIGAARASLIAETCGMVFAMVLVWRILPESIRERALLKKVEMRRWSRVALPLMGQLLIMVGTWTSFFFLVEKTGGMALKVSHVARNMFMLAFVITQGMGQTARTYVSGLIGESRQADLRPTLKRIWGLNMTGILIMCHGFVLYPDWISGNFFDTPEGIHDMSRTLNIIFVAVLMYSLSGIMLATIQGAGRTIAAFRIEILAVTIYMAGTYWVTIVNPQPVYVIWRMEFVYFSMLGLGGWLFLRRRTWLQPQAI